MTGRLELGTAKADITPSHPVALAGFAHRSGVFERIVRPLGMNIFCFRQGKYQALVVSADLIWWGSDYADRLKAAIDAAWPSAFDAVLLHATHNHCGPQTSGLFLKVLGEPDREYWAELEAKLLAGIGEALERMEPVSVERGRDRCELGIHRRLWKDGVIVMAPNPDGPADHELTVIRFRNDAGRVKGLFAHAACHPTTTGDNIVFPEFPGVAMEAVENALGEGAVAAYLQGYCGDVRPALIRDGAFCRGSADDAERLGIRLAEAVLRVLERPMEPLAASELRWEELIVPLPLRRVPARAELQAKCGEDGIVGEWAARLLGELENTGRLPDSVPLRLGALRLADGLTLLAADAEMVVEYGLFAKRELEEGVLPVGYTNGMTGYVPTDRQLAEGGYEAADSSLCFGLPSPYAAGIERNIKEGMRTLTGIVKPVLEKQADRLQVRVYRDRKQMGTAAALDVARHMRELLEKRPRIRMIFAAAPSQNEFLETLRGLDGIDWSRVDVFHMDEYIGLPSDAPQRFGRFLQERLFDAVRPGGVHLIDSSGDIGAECRRYGELIRREPIDIVCMGIGENGHIAFNDPPVADFHDTETIKPVELDDICRQQQVNDGCFASLADVPTHALTLTVPALMSGRRLFCIVPGPTKTKAVRETLYGPVSEACPSTILRTHPACTLYTDRDAFGEEALR
ncbi:glucosamine-6-phosphate deaminase [Paenibacillus cisolokensis]|uniref:glucosamine-6-phosphate deaminase n=1 Tax=Paenibacillus cisolokensis TaxID=1658519 RepID=UPI003D2A1844